MANVFPFPAVRPPADAAAAVSSPPYDVMSRDEAAELAAGNPNSFLHVTRSEIDMDPVCNPYAPEVYEKAAQNYKELKRDVPLTKDDSPCYYVYALEIDGHRQVGIAAAASVADYNNNIILKHEKTRKQKEDDRTNHILTVGAQTGPVFLTYRDHEGIDRLVERTVAEQTPLAEFTASDGVRNTVWKVDAANTETLKGCFAELPSLYIADGHHRAASAARVCEEMTRQNGRLAADHPAARFLSVIFPASQLRILAYNRVVEGLNGLTPAEFLSRLEPTFKVEKSGCKTPSAPRHVCMYFQGDWWTLTHTADISGLSASDSLDVALLQREVLDPILGIDDPRVDERIDFIGGIRGTAALEERVNSGKADVAFSMHPTTVEQLMAVSDAGDMMPPKSTWFEPKLRDGLLVHEVRDV